MADLKGKVVLITGSSSGIGAGTAVHFASLGSWLTLTGLGQADLEKVAKQCQEAGLPEDKIIFFAGDIRDQSFREMLVQETIKKFGKLDVLVNDAGMCPFKMVMKTTEEDFDCVFNTNLKAPFFLSQLALPHLAETKGCIVNVSSIHSNMTNPGYCAYAATKAGVDSITRSMAIEFGSKGVRVNSVNPGFVPTPILYTMMTDEQADKFCRTEIAKTPVQRNGTCEDIARAIAYLAGSGAGFVTGHHLNITGGRHITYLPFSEPEDQ